MSRELFQSIVVVVATWGAIAFAVTSCEERKKATEREALNAYEEKISAFEKKNNATEWTKLLPPPSSGVMQLYAADFQRMWPSGKKIVFRGRLKYSEKYEPQNKYLIELSESLQSLRHHEALVPSVEMRLWCEPELAERAMKASRNLVDSVTTEILVSVRLVSIDHPKDGGRVVGEGICTDLQLLK